MSPVIDHDLVGPKIVSNF